MPAPPPPPAVTAIVPTLGCDNTCFKTVNNDAKKRPIFDKTMYGCRFWFENEWDGWTAQGAHCCHQVRPHGGCASSDPAYGAKVNECFNLCLNFCTTGGSTPYCQLPEYAKALAELA